MVVVITATIVLALLCFTCGDVNVLSGIFAPFLIHFVLNAELFWRLMEELVSSQKENEVGTHFPCFYFLIRFTRLSD